MNPFVFTLTRLVVLSLLALTQTCSSPLTDDSPGQTLSSIAYIMASTPCCWKYWYFPDNLPLPVTIQAQQTPPPSLIVEANGRQTPVSPGFSMPTTYTLAVSELPKQVRLTIRWKLDQASTTLREDVRRRAELILGQWREKAWEQFLTDIENRDTQRNGQPYDLASICETPK